MFPLFIFTKKDVDREQLTLEEGQLYDAQINFLKADYRKALHEVSLLGGITQNEDIKLGCMAMQAICSLYLGDIDTWLSVNAQLDEIKKSQKDLPKETELLLDYPKICIYNITDIPQWLLKADFRGIDPEVLPLAQQIFMIVKRLEMVKVQQSMDMSLIECICDGITSYGILPLTIYAHLGTAIAYSLGGNKGNAMAHIEHVLGPILEHGWYGMILETYHLLESCYLPLLTKLEPVFVDRMKHLMSQKDQGWYKIYEYVYEDTRVKSLNLKELEIALNASYGYSNSEIAEITGFSLNTIKRYLNVIYQKLEVQNRKELSECIRKHII